MQIFGCPDWKGESYFCLTFDLDWASEFAVQEALKFLEDFKANATWFLTHTSEQLALMAADGHAHLGVHPNFLADSSHGNTISGVIEHVCAFAQPAECFRSHRYFDVTDTNIGLARAGLKFDSNLLTFMVKMMPFRHFSGLVRFPCHFEDGTWLAKRRAFDIRELDSLLYSPGPSVFGIHPMHIVLNSPTIEWSIRVKSALTRQQWSELKESDARALAYEGYGIKNFLREVLGEYRERGGGFCTLKDLYLKFLQLEGDPPNSAEA